MEEGGMVELGMVDMGMVDVTVGVQMVALPMLEKTVDTEHC